MHERFLLIDATGLVFRAYYSITPLTSPEGKPVNAIFGLVRMLLKLFRDTPAIASAVVFDAGAKTFRNEIYADYKAHRPPPPDDLRPQFAMAIEAVKASQVPVLLEPGFEADDIIATLADNSLHQGMEVSVLSSDRDLLQLLRPGLAVLAPQRDGSFKISTDESFQEEHGFPVNRFVDFKALMGDPSDNIPGVAGIGEKTAAKLVAGYGKLEQIYANLDLVKPPGVQAKLRQARADAFLFRDLVTLRTDVPVQYSFSDRTMPDFGCEQFQSAMASFGFSRVREDAAKLGDLKR